MTTTDRRSTIQSIIDNGYRVLPRPTDFADLLDEATEDEQVQLYMRMSDWIGDHNTSVMWWHAEGIRSGRLPRNDSPKEAAVTTTDDEPVCGESYDHDLREIDSRDGITTYECRECGAEIVTENGEN